MAEIQVLGLFHEAMPTAETLAQLRLLGVEDENVTVMSGMPYRAEMLGRPRPARRVGLIALVGASLGFLAGLFLTAGLFLLYPLRQGGQPIVPIPPTLIVLFELTMLGTMWAAFLGLMGENRFPIFKHQMYDPRITEGHIGVLVTVDDTLVDRAESILTQNGAHHLQRSELIQRTDYRITIFWASVFAVIILATAGLLLMTYDIIKIPFPTNMANQESTAYLQGPRKAAPVDAIPVQGPVLIDGQPATQPIPASTDSIQRGKALFGITCAVCHGPAGDGHSPVGSFFNPRPADLTGSQVQSLSDNEIYLVITEGHGLMPSMAENLDPQESWDVINFVRTLKK
jgi:mono/diheme cytochrome c family protein